jgi:hypothetical protein
MVLPVPDQVRDNGSGIQNLLNRAQAGLDSGFCRHDGTAARLLFFASSSNFGKLLFYLTNKIQRLKLAAKKNAVSKGNRSGWALSLP